MARGQHGGMEAKRVSCQERTEKGAEGKSYYGAATETASPSSPAQHGWTTAWRDGAEKGWSGGAGVPGSRTPEKQEA